MKNLPRRALCNRQTRGELKRKEEGGSDRRLQVYPLTQGNEDIFVGFQQERVTAKGGENASGSKFLGDFGTTSRLPSLGYRTHLSGRRKRTHNMASSCAESLF